MNVDVPKGFHVTSFGGTYVVPGARVHLRRDDGQWCVGTVQPDGSLTIAEFEH